MILGRLSSEQHGKAMLASIASQLKSAVGHPVVEIISTDTKPSTADTRNRNPRAGTGLARATADLIQRFRNDVRGPRGECFVKILSDSGKLSLIDEV